MSSFRVERWDRTSVGAALAVGAAVVVLALAPSFLGANGIDKLTTLFVYLILAGMWNAARNQYIAPMRQHQPASCSGTTVRK